MVVWPNTLEIPSGENVTLSDTRLEVNGDAMVNGTLNMRGSSSLIVHGSLHVGGKLMAVGAFIKIEIDSDISISDGTFVWDGGDLDFSSISLNQGTMILKNCLSTAHGASPAYEIHAGNAKFEDCSVQGGSPLARTDVSAKTRFVNVAIAYTQLSGQGITEIAYHLNVRVVNSMGMPVAKENVTSSFGAPAKIESRGTTDGNGTVTMDIIACDTTNGLSPHDPHQVQTASGGQTIAVASSGNTSTLVVNP